MKSLLKFAPALAVMAVGVALIIYDMGNTGVRLLGMALLLVSVALVRLSQLKSIRQREGYEPVTRRRKRNVVVLIVASLVIAALAIAAGVSLTSNDPSIQAWGSKLMLVAIGAVAALMGGAVNYFAARMKQVRREL